MIVIYCFLKNIKKLSKLIQILVMLLCLYILTQSLKKDIFLFDLKCLCIKNTLK